MAKVNPFYASESNVYHDNSRCTEGNNIESSNRNSGRGGRRLCSHCARL